QLENDPRAAIQFRHVERQRRPFGGHLDLGARSYVGGGDRVLLAVAGENDGRLSRSSTEAARAAGAAGAAWTGAGAGTTRTTGRCTRSSESTRTGTCAR